MATSVKTQYFYQYVFNPDTNPPNIYSFMPSEVRDVTRVNMKEFRQLIHGYASYNGDADVTKEGQLLGRAMLTLLYYLPIRDGV